MGDRSDLTARMRAAAEVLSEVASVFHPGNTARWYRSEYSSSMLLSIASKWDREDAEKDAESAAIEELVRELHLARIVANDLYDDVPLEEMSEQYLAKTRIEARQLYISGYRKGGAS